MTKIIYKDKFDGMVKIVKVDNVDAFLKHNRVEKVIGITDLDM